MTETSATLLRGDEKLAKQLWPTLERTRDVLCPGDTLIVCAGFEDRALVFLQGAIDRGSAGFNILGIDYRPAVAENRLGELQALADRARATLRLVMYDRQGTEDSNGILAGAAGPGKLFIDISGMSRLLIVLLIAASVRTHLLDRLILIYTEALVYPPTQAEVNARLAESENYLGILQFVSSGVFGVMVIPELSTVAMQGQPIRLIAFPSFNPTQLAAVCAEIQAAFCTIVNGRPPKADYLWRREAIRKLNSVDSIRNREEFDTSTFDYRETLELLLKLYREHGAVEKLVISPTGSKMQSVAVGLACGFLHDIQVVYPTPKSFPTPSNYTTGAIDSFRLPLRPFIDAY